MPTSTIAVGSKSITLVELPSCPAPKRIEFNIDDSVAVESSPYTGASDAQQWPGADKLSCTITYPPLTRVEAAPLKAFLMQMRGMANAVQLGDPLGTHPKNPLRGAPVVDGLGNAFGSQQLTTRGWPANGGALLAPYDWLQIGYRLYCNLEIVKADGAGKATLSIWPSLRESPPDGAAIKVVNTKGLFRLASNRRTWSDDVTRLSSISIQLTEYR